MTRRGLTLVEVVVGSMVGAMALSVAWGVFHLAFAPHRWGVAGMTRASFMQKDLRPGVRRLMRLVNEATELLEPAPGDEGETLVLRDLQGNRCALVVAPEGGLVVQGSGVVAIAGCTAARFTALGPHVVVASLTLEQGGQQQVYSMILETRNGHAGW
jgi:hypothetical protein